MFRRHLWNGSAMQTRVRPNTIGMQNILHSTISIQIKTPMPILAEQLSLLRSQGACQKPSTSDHPGAALGIDNCGRPLGERGGNVIGHWVGRAKVDLVPAVDGLHVPKRRRD